MRRGAPRYASHGMMLDTWCTMHTVAKDSRPGIGFVIFELGKQAIE